MANSRSKLASQINRSGGGGRRLRRSWHYVVCTRKIGRRPKMTDSRSCGWVWPQTEIGLVRVSPSYLYRSLFSLSYLILLSTYSSETSFLNLKARSYILADSKTMKINWTKTTRTFARLERLWNVSWIRSWLHHSVFFMRMSAIESLLLSKGHFRPYLIC